MIPSPLKSLVRTAFRRLGQEIIPAEQLPASNLMGLRHLGIRTILDIGANAGQFAAEAVQWFPGVTLYSFEPIPRAFDLLQASRFADVREFRAINCALGETDGEVEMNETVNDTTSSSLLKTTQEFTDWLPKLQKQAPTKVRLRRLDDAVREEQLALVPELLIKMDVQGFEDRVIRGGPETFTQARACIVEVILDSYYEGQATFLGLVAQLHALGLEYAGNFGQYHDDEDGHVAVIDAFFLRRRGPAGPLVS
jgi:FkbM family methyltransferase